MLINIVREDHSTFEEVLDKWAGLCDNDLSQILEFIMNVIEATGHGRLMIS
jgi:hypothetical protein